MEIPKPHFIFPTNTLMFRFTVWYILSLLFVILLIGFTLIGTISFFLIDHTKQEMRAVQKELKSTAQNEDKSDWQDDLDDILYPDHANYYVVVKGARGNVLAQSRGWNKAFNGQHEQVQSSWLKPLLWDQTRGFFLMDQMNWKQPNGGIGTITLAVQLTDLENLLKLIIRTAGLTTMIGMVVGSIIIYRLTRRNMQPLLTITNATERIKDSSDLTRHIPVPNGPRELTELARTLNNMLSQLEEQFEREKNFAANASHELRTPLTAMRGHLNLLKRWGKHDADVLNKSIQAIDEEGARMQRLIFQLLDLSQSDYGETCKEKVDVTEVVEKAVEQFGTRAPALNIEWTDPAFVLGDAEQIRQILVILLDNALKYTDPDGTVKISVRKVEQRVQFSVRDTGMGIPKEELPRIFERFYRVDKARSRKTGGTGLGLSIAKQLAERNGGEISVESEPGKGSLFTVSFPAL